MKCKLKIERQLIVPRLTDNDEVIFSVMVYNIAEGEKTLAIVFTMQSSLSLK